MRTDELIRALAADHRRPAPPVPRVAGTALLLGAAVAAAAFALELGPRPDLAAAAETARFLLKPASMLLLAAIAFATVLALARPGSDRRWLRPALLVVPVVMAIAVAAELAVTPAADWAGRLVGGNALFCLTAVPLLAAAPLAALTVALRSAAPTWPAGLGAAAGLLSGAVAAALYAIHCNDNSPLFVATWYTLAIGLTTIVGSLLGRRFLRW